MLRPCDLLCNLLIHLEIQREFRIVLLNNHTGGLLDGLGAHTAHGVQVEQKVMWGNDTRTASAIHGFVCACMRVCGCA